jgi:hypothetical protein
VIILEFLLGHIPLSRILEAGSDEEQPFILPEIKNACPA